MLRLHHRTQFGTEVPVETPPAPLPALTIPLFTADQKALADRLYLCPHWQRLTLRGTCVDDWWVGPPLSWFSAALITTAGMALIGWALVVAGKIRQLQPAVSKVRKVVKAPTWE